MLKATEPFTDATMILSKKRRRRSPCSSSSSSSRGSSFAFAVIMMTACFGGSGCIGGGKINDNSSVGVALAFIPTATIRTTKGAGTSSCCSAKKTNSNNYNHLDFFRLQAQEAGSFFNPVPEESNNDEGDKDDDLTSSSSSFEDSVSEILQKRNAPSLASTPSTINGVPTKGFGKKKQSSKNKKAVKKKSKPVVEIGPTETNPDPSPKLVGGPAAVNDVTKPEYDDQGYTLYSDEKTGEKSRVFEALVEYPTTFTLKIVGANEGGFVQDMVALVAECCGVSDVADVAHTTKSSGKTGKWVSVTVKAPVNSAEELYHLYESVDRDPRVKFKF